VLTTSRASLGTVPLRWIRLGVFACFGFLVAVWIARPFVIGDTPFLLDGTNAFIDCVSKGDLVACRHSEHLDYWGLTSPIGDWPLLQHIPDVVMVEVGLNGHPNRTRVLALLSVVGVVGAVVVARTVLSRIAQPAWFWGFLLVALSGPLLVYGRTTAGEALAAGLLVGLVAAAALRVSPPLLAAAALGACLTKETAYPFVAVLGVTGLLLARRRSGASIRRHLAWGAGGIGVAIVLASLFNIVRFGSVLNTNYLEPELHTPGLSRVLEYALALFVAPNGGMLVYWPAASALLLAACLLPLIRSGAQLPLWPALVLIAMIVTLTLGFAGWWDPFGTFYGPRLTLPWILPLVLLALLAYGDALGKLATRLLDSWWRLATVFVAILAFALPHVGHLWRPEATAKFFQGETPPCNAPWRGGVAAWHACQHTRLWFDRYPMPLYSIEGVRTLGGVVTSVVLALAIFGCLVLLRDELRLGDAAKHGSPKPRRSSTSVLRNG